MTKAEAIVVAQMKLAAHPKCSFLRYLDENFFAEVKNVDWDELGVHTLCAADRQYLIRVTFVPERLDVPVTVVDTKTNEITKL